MLSGPSSIRHPIQFCLHCKPLMPRGYALEMKNEKTVSYTFYDVTSSKHFEMRTREVSTHNDQVYGMTHISYVLKKNARISLFGTKPFTLSFVLKSEIFTCVFYVYKMWVFPQNYTFVKKMFKLSCYISLNLYFAMENKFRD